MSGSIYYGTAVSDAVQNGVPASLFTDVIQGESGFNASIVNPASGAAGIGQFLPSTAANPGYGIAPFNPLDPIASLSAAAQYLAALFNKTGSWTGALNAYSGNTSGGAPYPGNTSIAGDLNTLGEGGMANNTPGSSLSGASAAAGATAATASSAATGGSCGLSPSCWLSSLGTWASGFATRGALILLAIILLLGAVYLFAARTQQVSSSAA